MKIYTRKHFIRLGASAGAAFFLMACGAGSSAKKEDKPTGAAGKAAAGAPPEPAHSPGLDLADKNDSRYNSLRQGFNKRIDKHPDVIALCTTTAQVAAAVGHARSKGLPIAIKSGGHSMEGFSCNDGGMVINLSKMNKVEGIADNRIKVGPGCTLSELYNVILPQGRLLPAGSCGTVGLGGLTLGGGYGLFAREFGLTCDHLVSATMVDGHGNIHSTDDDKELLWALKGGGTGNFGIVTEMIFDTHPAPPQLQAHYFKARKLTAERASAILKAWMELMPQLPASCFSGYVLNGSTLNILVTNHDIDNAQLLAQLQQLAGVTDEFRSSKVNDLSRMLKNYYGRPGPLYFKNSSAGFFKDYNEVAPFIGQIFEQIVSTPGMIYQVNTLGGKIADAGFERSSSYPHRAFDFISELQAYWDRPSQEERATTISNDILRITAEHGISRQYVNYCSLAFTNWQAAYYGDNYTRLQAIKRKYDPDDNIRHPQSVKG